MLTKTDRNYLVYIDVSKFIVHFCFAWSKH